MTPLWQRQRCLRNDNGDDAIVTRTATLAWQWQQQHCNKGNNIIAMMAKMPGLHRHLHIDDDNTIALRVTMPAWRQQRSLHIDDGDDPIVTKTAETPSHQQWQLLHHDDGKDACNNKRAYHGAGSAA
jgi:hypothetical protein